MWGNPCVLTKAFNDICGTQNAPAWLQTMAMNELASQIQFHEISGTKRALFLGFVSRNPGNNGMSFTAN